MERERLCAPCRRRASRCCTWRARACTGASFESLQTKWIRKVTDEAEAGCHICLVGTKLDLVQAGVATRAVKLEEVEALAAKVCHTARVVWAVGRWGRKDGVRGGRAIPVAAVTLRVSRLCRGNALARCRLMRTRR